METLSLAIAYSTASLHKLAAGRKLAAIIIFWNFYKSKGLYHSWMVYYNKIYYNYHF